MPEQFAELIPAAAILIFCIVVGIPANSFAIPVYTRAIRYHHRKQQLRITITLLRVLSISDLMTCALVVPLNLYMVLKDYQTESEIICKLYVWASSSFVPFSAFLLAVIAVERYYCVCRAYGDPWRQRTLRLVLISLLTFTTSVGVICMLCYTPQPAPIWFMTTRSINLTNASISGHPRVQYCMVSSDKLPVWFIKILQKTHPISFIISIIVIAGSYSFLLKYVRKHRQCLMKKFLQVGLLLPTERVCTCDKAACMEMEKHACDAASGRSSKIISTKTEKTGPVTKLRSSLQTNSAIDVRKGGRPTETPVGLPLTLNSKQSPKLPIEENTNLRGKQVVLNLTTSNSLPRIRFIGSLLRRLFTNRRQSALEGETRKCRIGISEECQATKTENIPLLMITPPGETPPAVVKAPKRPIKQSTKQASLDVANEIETEPDYKAEAPDRRSRSLQPESPGTSDYIRRKLLVRKVQMANLHTAAKVSVLLIVFTVTIIPGLLVATQTINPPTVLLNVFYYVCFMNNCLNPLLYCFMNKRHRVIMRELVCNVISRGALCGRRLAGHTAMETLTHNANTTNF